jgi:hypothetical protein
MSLSGAASKIKRGAILPIPKKTPYYSQLKRLSKTTAAKQ